MDTGDTAWILASSAMVLLMTPGLATGLFVGIGFGALAEGVSRGEQILLQLVAIGATWGWSFVMTAIILLALKYTIGLRVSEEEESVGLDASQHGEITYIG